MRSTSGPFGTGAWPWPRGRHLVSPHISRARSARRQAHYPFENKEAFEASFPADFIAEGIDQTRGWFYTLMVLSTALFDKPPFKNLICNGLVLAADGQKMSKRKQNYPPPEQIIDKYGRPHRLPAKPPAKPPAG